MEVLENLEYLFRTARANLKSGTDQIRYNLARKGISKTPSGAESYLEQSLDLLLDEIFKILNEIKAVIYKSKEWEPVRTSVAQFIENECRVFIDFLVNNWEQPSSNATTTLLSLSKSSIYNEINIYIDRQKIKLSKGEQTTWDILKIVFCGLAAGIVGYLLKMLVSH